MIPAVEAARVYEREPCSHDFEHDLYWHLIGGYVFSTPEYFIMGRAVDREAPEHLLLDVKNCFGAPNAWLVWLGAGDMSKLPEVMPYWLPWIGFQRRNRLRWYRTEELLCRMNRKTLAFERL